MKEITLAKTVKSFYKVWIFIHKNSKTIPNQKWFEDNFKKATKVGGMEVKTIQGKQILSWGHTLVRSDDGDLFIKY